jgi:hypothetical protein
VRGLKAGFAARILFPLALLQHFSEQNLFAAMRCSNCFPHHSHEITGRSFLTTGFFGGFNLQLFVLGLQSKEQYEPRPRRVYSMPHVAQTGFGRFGTSFFGSVGIYGVSDGSSSTGDTWQSLTSLTPALANPL